jgi:hypothetical protein
MGEDEEAQYYDLDLKLICSLITDSRGAQFVLTAELGYSEHGFCQWQMRLVK